MEKKVIIIGGGITGLSAGCYLRMNGYPTSVFEMHDRVGGVCTGWTRKGYTIDGAMDWLVGTKAGKSFYSIWEELGALQGRTVVDHEQFMRVEGSGGKVLVIYCDADRLEQHMKELAPEDAKAIEEFTDAVRGFTKFKIPWSKAPELISLVDRLKMVKMLPQLLTLRKWTNRTTADFCSHFRNPFLREALSAAFVRDMDIATFFMLMTLAWLHQKMAGYPVGGALELARAIERRYLDLGGEIHCSSRVEKILVENNKAVGIRLADGTEHRSDIVVSAADGRTTIFEMLEGKYLDARIRGYYENPQLFPPLIYIGLGVARAFDDVPPSVMGLNFPLEEPLEIAGRQHRRMDVQIYNFDKTMAPRGKTVLKVQYNTEYDYWKKLREEPERYKAEKEKIADQVVARLDKRFPGLAAKVEMRDVATPITWERYTGNWRGSYMGWSIAKWSLMGKRMSKTLPGLDNFYMAGQWVEPGGGLPTAAMSGRNVTQIICNKDKKTFTTTKQPATKP